MLQLCIEVQILLMAHIITWLENLRRRRHDFSPSPSPSPSPHAHERESYQYILPVEYHIQQYIPSLLLFPRAPFSLASASCYPVQLSLLSGYHDTSVIHERSCDSRTREIIFMSYVCLCVCSMNSVLNVKTQKWEEKDRGGEGNGRSETDSGHGTCEVVEGVVET